MNEALDQDGKAARSGRAKRVSRYPGWVLAYFVLGAFDILTVTGSLGLHHRLANIHADAMAENQLWATRLEGFQELEALIAQINAPGNDVFRTGDVARERERQKKVTGEFRNEIAQIRISLLSDLEEAQRQSLFVFLDAFDRTTQDMVGHSGLLFDSFESGDVVAAGKHMANMDREYARLISLMARMEKLSHGFLQKAFDRQGALAQDMRYVEVLIAILIVIMVRGAAV